MSLMDKLGDWLLAKLTESKPEPQFTPEAMAKRKKRGIEDVTGRPSSKPLPNPDFEIATALLRSAGITVDRDGDTGKWKVCKSADGQWVHGITEAEVVRLGEASKAAPVILTDGTISLWDSWWQRHVPLR